MRRNLDFALYHAGTHRAGSPGYYAPLPRGHFEVLHDSKRYIYDVRGIGVTAGEARDFVTRAWDCRRSEVVGAYPRYEVERN